MVSISGFNFRDEGEKDILMNKKLIPLIIVIISLTIGGVLLTIKGNDAVSVAERKKESLLTADKINLSFQGVGGRVTAISAAEQQDVKAGDVLMTLDTTDIDLQIEQLKASISQQDVRIQQAQLQQVRSEDLEKQLLVVNAAQENLDLVQLNYDRNKALFEAEALSKAGMDTIANQLETAKNTLAQQQVALNKIQAQNQTDRQNYSYNSQLLNNQKDALELQLQALQNQKQRMTLTAPCTGKVTKITPKVGENISSAAIAAIIESQQLYFNIYISESQISKFQIDERITCKITSLNKNIEGTVKSINVAPPYASQRMSRDKGLSDISMFIVRIEVPALQELLTGMTMEVNIQ